MDARWQLLEHGREIDSGEAKIRGHGNSTWTTFDTNKRSYLLKLSDERSLLGLPSAQKWVLLANVTDKTSLRNTYAMHLAKTVWNTTGWIPEQVYSIVVVNGKFLGLYLLSEKVEQHEHRLSLPEGSFLAVVDTHQGKEWDFTTTQGRPMSIREPNIRYDDMTAYYTRAEAWLQHFESVLFSDAFADEQTGYRAYIDMDSFVDWYLVNEFTKNHDARFQSSCYLFFDAKTRRLHMGPVWDFDIACGNVHSDDAEKTEGYIVATGAWYERLLSDPFFAQAVRDRYREKRAELDDTFAWIHKKADEIAEAVLLNERVWRQFGHRQWPNAPGYRTRKTYQAECDYLFTWLTERASWLDAYGWNEWLDAPDLAKTTSLE